MKLTKADRKFTVTFKLPRVPVASLSNVQKANLAYDAFGQLADWLADHGIDPDLVATAASDLAHQLTTLDGTPRRVVRLEGRATRLKGEG